MRFTDKRNVKMFSVKVVCDGLVFKDSELLTFAFVIIIPNLTQDGFIDSE